MFNLAVCSLMFTAVNAQQIDTKHITYDDAKESLKTLKELLAIPNDANYPDDIEKNVQWCEKALDQFGFITERLETETVPLLMAKQREVNDNLPTLLYYFHIDGQPVDPSFWFQADPYQSVLKEEREAEGWVDIDWSNVETEPLNPDWRIFARSSSDDKSPFVMMLAAMNTLVKEKRDFA